MAIIDVTRLFPPIIATYLPAKDILSINDNSSSCPQGVGGIEIPFDINQLNNINDIKEIHVSITRQSNYQSLFNSNDYPMGIYILSADNNIKTNKSFIVPNSVLNKDQLNFNEYYKIQLRFSSDSNGHSKTGQILSNYLLNESYMAKFSEWSTVSLLRFVAKPTISLQGNLTTSDKTLDPDPDPITLHSLDGHYLNLTGKFIKSGISRVLSKDFQNANDNEYLSSWRIKVFNGETGTEILDSGVQQVNYRGSNLDEIKYNVPCYFDKDVNNYSLVLYITTANLYTANFTYYIKTTSSENSWGSQSEIAEYTSLDSVIGKVNITFEPVGNTTVPAGGSIIIRRASDKDNFGYWEPIWSKNSMPELKPGDSIIYDDFTIESGVIYKYNIAYTKNNETYSITEGPILSIFDNAFLTGENTQLCVKFNPNISSFKVNVSDNIVNTIGGKYPIINRNSNMYYRSFSLSGTIAYEMDAEHQFATRSSIYGEWINVYGTYFVNRYINAQNDRITQRKFRELVMSYLYDDVPKLFRSTPEGNILVRLTDITLSPKQELGRMIYDFSCTATEIGDCNIDNYKIYQIQDFGDI